MCCGDNVCLCVRRRGRDQSSWELWLGHKKGPSRRPLLVVSPRCIALEHRLHDSKRAPVTLVCKHKAWRRWQLPWSYATPEFHTGAGVESRGEGPQHCNTYRKLLLALVNCPATSSTPPLPSPRPRPSGVSVCCLSRHQLAAPSHAGARLSSGHLRLWWVRCALAIPASDYGGLVMP